MSPEICLFPISGPKDLALSTGTGDPTWSDILSRIDGSPLGGPEGIDYFTRCPLSFSIVSLVSGGATV